MTKKDSMQPDQLGPGGYYEEETYSKGLNREDTIEGQIRTILFFYTRQQWPEFIHGVQIFYAVLPKAIRESIEPVDFSVTSDGVKTCYKKFIEIQNVLETDTNMIFKKKFIKTYE